MSLNLVCSLVVPSFELNFSIYTLMLALGAFAGIFVCVLRAPLKNSPSGVSKLYVFLCAFYALVFGLIGAKLFFVAGNLKYVFDGTRDLFSLFLSGFMFYGGLFGGAAGILLFSLVSKTSPALFFDALAPGVALGQCIGRLGCFFAGCCHGVHTTGVFSIVYHNSIAEGTPLNVPLVPTQLIESAFCLLIFAVLLFYGRRAGKVGGGARACGIKIRQHGNVFVLYLAMYAVLRFIVEFWRGDPVRGFVGLLSWSQFIGILILLSIGIYLLIRYIRQRKKINIEFGKNFLDNY